MLPVAVVVFASIAVALFALLRYKMKVHDGLRVSKGGREMGLLERWYSASAESDTMPNFGFCVQFKATSDETASLAWWQHRLDVVATELCARHALLNVGIVDDYNEGAKSAAVHNFVRLLSSVDPHCVLSTVHRTDETTWRQELGVQFSTPLAPNAPLFRLVLIHPVSNLGTPQDVEVLVVLHHAIADGIAGGYLVSEVARLVCGSTLVARAPMARPCNDPLPPALDVCVDLRPRLGYALYEVVKEKFPALRKLEPDVWLGPCRHVPAARRTGVTVYGSLPAKLLAQVKAACTANRVTVHGAVAAAAAIAASTARKRLGLTSGSGSRISVDSAVSLRPSSVPPSQLGTYVTAITVDVEATTDGSCFWKIAKSVVTSVHSETNRRKAASMIGLMAFLSGSWLAFFRRRVELDPNGRTATTTLSNLGVVSFPGAGDQGSGVQCHGGWFSQVKPKEGGLFTVSVMTANCSPDNNDAELRIAVSVPSPVLSEADALAFLDNALSTLQAACRI
jgi:hypothetical protein